LTGPDTGGSPTTDGSPDPDGSAGTNGSAGTSASPASNGASAARSASETSAPDTNGRRETSGALRSLLPVARLRALVAENKIMVLVLIPAVLLRVDAELGYRWQSWFNDSFQYMNDVVAFHPDVTRVAGYAVFLKILEPLHSYALITILQHLMGVAVGVMVYALARHRFGAPAWVAALAAVPVLYDGFQIQLEHLILSDVPFEFLITLAATLVLWDKKVSWRRWALAGLIVGVSATVRSLGEPLIVVFVVYLIIQRAGWRALGSTLVACAVPVLLYASWFKVDYGQFAMTDSQGVFLYSRVMTFAECSQMHVPTDELSLCTTTPPAKRPIAQAYIWTNVSPLDRFPPTKFSPLPNQLAEDFAKRAILSQPVGYLKAVAHDVLFTFHWKRSVFPNAATYDEYLFGKHSLAVPSWAAQPYHGYSSQAAYYGHGDPLTKVVNPYAVIIRDYQRYVWLPGTVYGLILLIGLGGMIPAWRRWGGPAVLPWTISVVLIVVPAATAEFDYRYVLPAVPFACLAAAMAFGKGTAARNWLAAQRGGRAVAAGPARPGQVSDGPGAGPGAGREDDAGQELARGETTAS
jgi:Dolichyl-phosphate-mannose-protein mannosyltransferase